MNHAPPTALLLDYWCFGTVRIIYQYGVVSLGAPYVDARIPERIREGVKALGGVIKQEMASRKGFELKG